MTTFIKASEAPQTKLRLKKAILNGSIIVFESNSKNDLGYKKLENQNSFLRDWSGVHYFPKCLGDNIAYACYGTSYYYQFAKA
jgi:hypothetical protein